MTSEQVRTTVRHALDLLLTEPPETLRAMEPWLTREHIGWCQAHWHEPSPETQAFADFVTRASTLLYASRSLLPADWAVILDVLKEATADEHIPNPEVHQALAKVQQMLARVEQILAKERPVPASSPHGTPSGGNTP